MCDSCGCGEIHEHEHDGSRRTLDVRQDVLSRNDGFAADNRGRLAQLGTLALNLISSPGTGKTTLLEATIRTFHEQDSLPLAVIEGDLQTDRDAARIRDTGAPVYQVNTGEGCHLDAHMVGHAMDHLELPEQGVLFIENVGNLVCPASFDLGESLRVTLLSVTEGDDKVEKYPVAFRGSHVLIITKTDLLPYVDFDVDRCRAMAKSLNPDLEVFEVSAKSGDGIDDWCQWVRSKTM
jgi:hydrogenase nickel incorporation protein HypB